VGVHLAGDAVVHGPIAVVIDEVAHLVCRGVDLRVAVITVVPAEREAHESVAVAVARARGDVG